MEIDGASEFSELREELRAALDILCKQETLSSWHFIASVSRGGDFVVVGNSALYQAIKKICLDLSSRQNDGSWRIDHSCAVIIVDAVRASLNRNG
jgi:hypothetical protein